MNDLIKKLVEAYGPSGFEDQMRELIRPEIESYADELSVDAMGNLIAFKKGNGDGLKVMLAAHMDEIGVMVSHITKEGFLRFTNIGGVMPHNLRGSRVQFANGTVANVIASRVSDAKMRRIRVFQPNGYMSLDFAGQTVDVAYPRPRPDREWPDIVRERIELEPVKPLDAELDAFVDTVRTGAPPLVDGRVGLEALDVALQVREKIQA